MPVLAPCQPEVTDVEDWDYRAPRPFQAGDDAIVLNGKLLGQQPPPVHAPGAHFAVRRPKSSRRTFVESAAARMHVEERLAALTPGQREVLMLQLEGLSYAEIEQMTGLSPTTIRERLRRARAALKSASDEA